MLSAEKVVVVNVVNFTGKEIDITTKRKEGRKDFCINKIVNELINK
jgi:hypothetical protein